MDAQPTTTTPIKDHTLPHLQAELAQCFLEQAKLSWQKAIEQYKKSLEVNPSLVLNTFLDTLTALSRDGCEIENISDTHYMNLFKAISSGKASKEAIGDVLEAVCKNPGLTVDKAAKKLNTA